MGFIFSKQMGQAIQNGHRASFATPEQLLGPSPLLPATADGTIMRQGAEIQAKRVGRHITPLSTAAAQRYTAGILDFTIALIVYI